MKYMSAGEFDKAEPVLMKAITLAENNKQKGEIQMELAKIYTRAGKSLRLELLQEKQQLWTRN